MSLNGPKLTSRHVRDWSAGALSGRAEHAKTSVKNQRLELQELFYWCVSDCHVNQGAILKPRD
jgi:hypothetical protein